MLRWINLGLAILLATLLVVELMRSTSPEPSGPAITEGPPVVVQETPGRRSRRLETKMAQEEARRQQRERAARQPGPVQLDRYGGPIRD